MAWEGSNRRAELPADWPARREACKQRAGGRCEWVRSSGRRCTSPGTDADHRTSRDNHDDLQWLCRFHHNMKTQAEAQAAKAAKRAKLRDEPEPHPGRRRKP